MADNGSGSGFMGLLAGLLIAVLLIVGGVFLFNGGFGGGGESANINVEVPQPSPPG